MPRKSFDTTAFQQRINEKILNKLYDSDISKYFKDSFMAWDRADTCFSTK